MLRSGAISTSVSMVWALPVIFVVVAVAGLVYRFRDYRPSARNVTQADRDLVADALDHPAAQPAADHPDPPPSDEDDEDGTDDEGTP